MALPRVSGTGREDGREEGREGGQAEGRGTALRPFRVRSMETLFYLIRDLYSLKWHRISVTRSAIPDQSHALFRFGMVNGAVHSTFGRAIPD